MFSLLISGQSQATEMAALVSEVSGNVKIKINGSSSPAKLLASIPLGARVDLVAGASLTMIYIINGNEYKLTGPGSYQFDASSPKTISGIVPAKLTSIAGALNGKKIRPENVAQATSSMRKGIKEIHLPLEPLTPSGCVTLADPLMLQWRAPAEGLTYNIQIINNKNEVLFTQEVTANTVTLPSGLALSGGDYYVWEITTVMPNGAPISASAKFKVASNEIREQATKLKPGTNGTVSERVAYGLWLEAVNLPNEAVHVWVELAEDYPDEPNIRDRANLKP
jgi:hypothetical protein